MGRVLVVDDEQSLRDVLEVLITSKGHSVRVAKSVDDARAALSGDDFDIVITDLRLAPNGDGMDVVRVARAKPDAPEVLVMTAYGTREKALMAVQEGAAFYLEKGPHLATDIDVLVAQAIHKRRMQADNDALRRALINRYTSADAIVARSGTMKEILDVVDRVAPTRANVLIVGESGTGKERIAKRLHYGSENRSGPFVPLNCGAIPENLIESELFGHTKGAFTGADTNKHGMFEAARGGTLFLDEIGELPIALQPKLLRTLQERTVKPVGATQEVEVDCRVIAATNRDLEAEVRAGRFREDLFFRLNVLQIDLPPLRQRREDIPLLAATFLEKYTREYARSVNMIAPEAMERLLAFPFPGNVRQLENVIERGVALATSNTLTVAQLPKELKGTDSGPTRVVSLETNAPFPDEGVDLERLVDELERTMITRALEKAGGVKTKAAELLGLSFRQFRYKVSKYEKWRDDSV
jgi:two-component system response regulator PilR (NtrC family)